MSYLFSPLKLRDVTFRNRIVVSPMCQYSSVDGLASDWHLVHLGARASGGAGLVITEAAAVDPEGRISPQDLGIWDDQQIPKLKRVTDFIRSQGAASGIQLAHAGRKASTSRPWEVDRALETNEGGWRPVLGPSALAFDEAHPVPQALSIEQVKTLPSVFARAAERSLAAGFDVVEIHAAHGYLLHEFLSPLSNQRTDAYGGSFENRIRALLEVTEEVRKRWPERLPLWVRISATDWVDGGWTADESVELCKNLKTKGVDLVDCSSGGLVPYAKIPIGAGFQAGFAERIRREAGIATGAVGFITDPAQAETIVRTGQADAVLLAREMLRDPYWPLHAAKALHTKPNPPIQYARAF